MTKPRTEITPAMQRAAWCKLWDILLRPPPPDGQPMSHRELAAAFNQLPDATPEPDDLFELPEDMQGET